MVSVELTSGVLHWFPDKLSQGPPERKRWCLSSNFFMVIDVTAISSAQTDKLAARRNFWGLILGLTGVLVFSATLPATRLAVESFAPWFVTFGRAALASLAAMLCLLVMRKRLPRRHLKALAFIGVTLVFGFPGFMALAMMTVPSAHGGVVLGILPLATAVFAALWAGERPSLLFWLCGIAGAAVIIIFALRGGGFTLQVGDLWLFAAGITASAGYVISGKLSHELPGWEVICWALVLTAPFSIAGTIWLWDSTYTAAPQPQVLAFLYLGLGSMFLGFFAWNNGLRLGGLARIGQLQLFQTFFTIAIAGVLLGETITLETWLFAAAVFVIVWIGRKSRVTAR